MLRMAERQGMPKEESMALLNILEEMQSAKFTHLSDLRFIIKKLDGEETVKKE